MVEGLGAHRKPKVQDFCLWTSKLLEVGHTTRLDTWRNTFVSALDAQDSLLDRGQTIRSKSVFLKHNHHHYQPLSGKTSMAMLCHSLAQKAKSQTFSPKVDTTHRL